MNNPLPRRRRLRFSIFTLLLVMLVFSVTGAGISYLAHSLRTGDRTSLLAFIVLTISAPVLVMVVVSLLAAAGRRRS